jgi:transcriptional regulator with XRE-family HTH domain
MSVNQPLNFLLPEDLARRLGERARSRRLAANLTRKTLAIRSGVPESTIRKFEVTGTIGVVGLLQLADALGCMDDFNQMFPPKVAASIDEFVAPTRKRGRK